MDSEHQPTIIFRGQRIWDESCKAASIASANTVVLFDKHDVVDTLNNQQAIQAGEAIDYMPGIRSVLLSYGRDNRKGSFNPAERWRPYISCLDGYISTDYPDCWLNNVEAYGENWMPLHCIAIRGDKGQAAELLGKPALLFDDKEHNVDLVRSRSSHRNKLDGVVVRMGRKCRYNVAPGYISNYRCSDWEGLVAEYDYYHGRATGEHLYGDSGYCHRQRPPTR